jgi:hypothetical protein
MNVRIFVQRTNIQPGANTEFVDIPNGDEAIVPNVGDTVQIAGMSFPETVKARHFKFLDAQTVEVRLDI